MRGHNINLQDEKTPLSTHPMPIYTVKKISI